MQLNGVPVTETENGFVTERGRWMVSEDDVFPGDEIPWPGAFDNDPVGLEHLSWFIDGVDPQPLTVHAIDPDEPPYPCAFCSSMESIAERGVIDSDYELRADGELVGRVCHACIADAGDW